MSSRFVYFVFITVLTASACATAPEPGSAEARAPEIRQAVAAHFMPLPDTADDAANPVTVAKVALGKKLYYDAQLSLDGTVSCNSCHDLATFGVDNQPTSMGVDGMLGERNSPTVLNAAFHLAQFWDGRADSVEDQAGMPILNPVEMAIPSEAFLVDRLAATEDYPRLFAEAFPGGDEGLTFPNIARALAAFERTLITPSRFDAFLEGDDTALTSEELSGLETFVNIGCSTCHNSTNVGAFSFMRFGITADYWEHTGSTTVDEGRARVTGREADQFVFRVASLRNVEKTAPYFHDGSVEALDEAVRVMVRVQLGLEVGDEDIANLVAFLRSLTGTVPPEALLNEAGQG